MSFSKIIFLILILISGCQEGPKLPRGTSIDNPFIMALIPSENATGSIDTITAIQSYLEKDLSTKLFGANSSRNFYVKVKMPTSYIAVLEAFGSGRIDFAPISTLNYFIAKYVKKLPVETILTGIGYNGQDFYNSQIIVRNDSKIKKLIDLNGKRFAYSDPASTSGHLVPKSFLKKKHIKLGQIVFAGRHDTVASMVYQGKVDAGATYYIPPDQNGRPRDAREKILTQFPDAFKQIRILTLSPPIPNSPWIMRTNIYPKDKTFAKKVKKALQQSMINFGKTQIGKKIFHQLMNIQNVRPITDHEYEEKLKVFSKEDLEFLQKEQK